jgi:uncharacterized membrane protein YGL010W
MPHSSTSSSHARAQHWFAAYSADHQHPLNQRLHQWCVPAILWSLVVLLSLIPLGVSGASFEISVIAWGVSALALGFWVWLLPWRLALMLAVVLLACLLSGAFLRAELGTGGLFALALGVFFIAWVGQFIGHYVEGKRPSFFTDLVYLMIGPPWVIIKLMGSQSIGMPSVSHAKTESEG